MLLAIVFGSGTHANTRSIHTIVTTPRLPLVAVRTFALSGRRRLDVEPRHLPGSRPNHRPHPVRPPRLATRGRSVAPASGLPTSSPSAGREHRRLARVPEVEVASDSALVTVLFLGRSRVVVFLTVTGTDRTEAARNRDAGDVADAVVTSWTTQATGPVVTDRAQRDPPEGHPPSRIETQFRLVVVTQRAFPPWHPERHDRRSRPEHVLPQPRPAGTAGRVSVGLRTPTPWTRSRESSSASPRRDPRRRTCPPPRLVAHQGLEHRLTWRPVVTIGTSHPSTVSGRGELASRPTPAATGLDQRLLRRQST